MATTHTKAVWVSDIETDGLLDTVSKFHCAWLINMHTGERLGYRPNQFAEYVQKLEEVSDGNGIIAFHNGIEYDHPAINILSKKLLGRPLKVAHKSVIDTLVLSRLVYSNLKDTDAVLLRKGVITGKQYGSHSLKAWGYRLGNHKIDFATDSEDDWTTFTEEMYTYCEQDVVVTVDLLKRLLTNKWYFPEGLSSLTESVELEHSVAWLMAKQKRNGFPFDTRGAINLYADLSAEREAIRSELIATFPNWYVAKGGNVRLEGSKFMVKCPKVNRAPYTKGVMYTPVTLVEFNPTSRQHIIKVLSDCGWVPTDFSEAGNPVVDDETLGVICDAPNLIPKQYIGKVQLIRKYLVVSKLIGQLAEGDKAWLRYDKDGYIHGSVNPNGAVTGRATHSFPNMAQIPSIRKYKGKECRALFGAAHHRDLKTKQPWVQVGVDASGLELRCLGHYMAAYDGGEYINIILNGDIHTTNQEAAGLPTRDNAKTFIYGFLYGAGAEKIGEIVGKYGEEGKRVGKDLITRFMEKTPAIAALREALVYNLIEASRWVGNTQQITWKRKWIKGLDGRQVAVRSPHAALNSLLQSAGALICKKWIVEYDRGMRAAGYKHGWDGDYCFMAWVHDEQQVACRTQEIADHAVLIAQEAMRKVGEHWKFRCQLDTEGKTGTDWAVCH